MSRLLHEAMVGYTPPSDAYTLITRPITNNWGSMIRPNHRGIYYLNQASQIHHLRFMKGFTPMPIGCIQLPSYILDHIR